MYALSHVPQNNSGNISIDIIPTSFHQNESKQDATVLLSTNISSKMHAAGIASKFDITHSVFSNTVGNKMLMHYSTLPSKRTVPTPRVSKENLQPLIDVMTTVTSKEMDKAFTEPIAKEVLPECPKTPPGLQVILPVLDIALSVYDRIYIQIS